MELFSWVSLAILNSSLALSLPQAEQPLSLTETDIVQVALDFDSDSSEPMASKEPCDEAMANTVLDDTIVPIWTEAARSIQQGAIVFQSKERNPCDVVRLEIRPGPVWSGMAARLRF
ncbi:MAG: hypothetical protein IPJ88_01720 [Myxococcales bacterium]|nr:MAG: hypothetical protein IPJ88_01720 [Myxococcales bacterium]